MNLLMSEKKLLLTAKENKTRKKTDPTSFKWHVFKIDLSLQDTKFKK